MVFMEHWFVANWVTALLEGIQETVKQYVLNDFLQQTNTLYNTRVSRNMVSVSALSQTELNLKTRQKVTLPDADNGDGTGNVIHRSRFASRGHRDNVHFASPDHMRS